MSFLRKSLLTLLLVIGIISLTNLSFADIVTIPTTDLTDASIGTTPDKLDVEVKNTWLAILETIKIILNWILVIFMVYIWATMIMSMWTNDEDLSSAKKQIRYAMIWLVFINIPWTLYNAIQTDWWSIWWNMSKSGFTSNYFSNAILNWGLSGVVGNIVSFMEVLLFIVAIFMFVMAWLLLITSRWREEKMTEAKTKLIYGVLWLIFVWFIESWKAVAFGWSVSGWISLFHTMLQIALFFVWATVMLFLTLASYYIITSSWDEEKVKKWKTIIVNSLIAIVILLASYTFLVDLITL